MRNVVHVAQETRKSARPWMWAIIVADGIETAALLAGAILLIGALIGGFTDDKSMAVFVLVFGAGMGLVLAWTLKSLYRGKRWARSEEHTSELQSRGHLVCRLLLEKKNITTQQVLMI